MFKDVFHVAVAQGPRGPDGPLGEPGPEGVKVNMRTTSVKTSPHAFEDWIRMKSLYIGGGIGDGIVK